MEGYQENSESEEDTYFGPDPIPCSLEPNQTETAIISVHQPIQEQCACVDALPDTEIYTAIEIIITDVTESTDAQDEANINPSPGKENMSIHERSISEGEEMTTQPEEIEESLEDEKNMLEFKTPEHEEILRENKEDPEEEVEEIEECVTDVNETTGDEEEHKELKKHQPCESAEQESVEMENSFDSDTENSERNVEATEIDTRVNTHSDDERSAHIVEGNISREDTSEDNSCEDHCSTSIHHPNEVSCGQTEEPVNEKSSVTSDEEPPQDLPASEEERETSALKQVKAVPAVPPKPQRSKLTALTLRKQFEHRDAERQQRHSQVMDTDGQHETEEHQTDDTRQRDHDKTEHTTTEQADETAENCGEPTSDTNGGGTTEDDEIKAQREGLGSGDAGIDFRRDLHRDGEREMKRNSGISMCFDEAVARATEKRSRETSERLSGAQWERESRREGFKHKEKDDENKTD